MILKKDYYPQCQTIFLQLQKAIKQNISLDEIEKLTNQLKDKTNNCLQLVTQTKQKQPLYFLVAPQLLHDFNSSLDNLIECFKNTYIIVDSLISLISVLQYKKQEQKDLRKQTHVKVFEVIYRLIEKTPSIIFKPFKQKDFVQRATLQSFIEYQRQISQQQMKQQLNKLEKKMDKMLENKVNSQKEVLMAKNVKDKQLQIQRLKSDINEQSIRNQQQVSRLSLQLSSKDQTIKQLLTSIKQLQTCIKQFQTSNQTQSQQANSIMSQQQTTIQSQHEQLNQRSQQLQSQSQELVALSQQLALNKKLLQETISRNSQQTTKIIQENEAMKKKLEERDQQIQRLNEEVGFLGLATKDQQQTNTPNQLLQKILNQLQHIKNDEISTITKKNHELQTQKLLLQAKLNQALQAIAKDSKHDLKDKCDVNIRQLKQDIARGLDKLSEMECSTERYDKVVGQLNDEIIQLKGKIYLQDKIIAQLQQSLKQCQTESVKTKKSHQLQLKRSQLQYQAQVQKAASLSNLLQQRQKQCESLRHQLQMKSKQVIELTIQNQRLQNDIDEAA